MVEFAVALPVFLLLLFGIIEFGRLLMTYVSVYTAAREAARYGSAAGVNDTGTRYYRDCDGIKDAAVRMAGLAGVTKDNVTIYYNDGSSSCPYETKLGDLLVVVVSGTFEPILPLVNIPPLTVSSRSSRTIVQQLSIYSTPTAPTPIPTPDCSLLLLSGLQKGQDIWYTNITNNSAHIVSINSVTVTWDFQYGFNLIAASLGDDNIIWSGTLSKEEPITQFINNLSIPDHTSKTLTFFFSPDRPNNLDLDISFSNGCSYHLSK